MNISTAHTGRHSLCFTPPGGAAQPFMFRCGVAGHIDLDALDRRQRFDCFLAGALVGRPVVRPNVVILPGSES